MPVESPVPVSAGLQSWKDIGENLLAISLSCGSGGRRGWGRDYQGGKAQSGQNCVGEDMLVGQSGLGGAGMAAEAVGESYVPPPELLGATWTTLVLCHSGAGANLRRPIGPVEFYTG